MKKVGILSMQRICNYGSFLQAYGLKQMFEELGCEVQFVDYHPGKCLCESREGKGIFRKVYKLWNTLKNGAAFYQNLKYINYKRGYSSKYFPYLGIDQQMNYFPEVDLLVIGSDEVFNCVQDNTNVGFSPELFGKGNNAKRLISYAASFGNTTLEMMKEYKVDSEIAGYLKNFDDISVRDGNSLHIIKNLLGYDAYYNIDPVLAYNFIDKCNEVPKIISEKDYLILYGYSGRFTDEECQSVRDYANDNGYKIVCIGGVQKCCDEFIDCSPFEVIAYFKNAECIVTDTFHGTILSLITHQNFVTYVRKNGYGNYEKLMDLLRRFHVEDRMLEGNIQLKEKLKKMIDYNQIDLIINEEREKTYSYLKKQVDLL